MFGGVPDTLRPWDSAPPIEGRINVPALRGARPRESGFCFGRAMERSDTADTWLDLPPAPSQTRWALAVTAVVLVGFAAVVPVAGRPLAQLNAFFPSLDAIVLVSDLITAVLLYAQFSISRSRALLALAVGYLFTALIVIPHALTSPAPFRQADCSGRISRPGPGSSSSGTSAFPAPCSPTRCCGRNGSLHPRAICGRSR